MKRNLLGVLMFLILICWGAGALADPINLPVKWSQLPDLNIANNPASWPSDHPIVVVSNDWQCNDPNPVVAVRWWGTYVGAAPPPGINKQFELVFHADIPAGVNDPVIPPGQQNPLPFSHPATPVLWGGFVAAQETALAGPGGIVNGQQVYEYDAYLPTPFSQSLGTIYWLDIAYDNSPLPNPQILPGGATWDRWQAVNMILDATVSEALPHQGWTGQPLGADASFEIMVPIPSTLPLMGSGLFGLAVMAYRRWRK